jgi:hypothetical protein
MPSLIVEYCGTRSVALFYVVVTLWLVVVALLLMPALLCFVIKNNVLCRPFETSLDSGYN